MSTFREVAEEIKKGLNDLRNEARKSFISGVYGLHKGIINKFYSSNESSNEGVRRRTGTAAKSWKVEVSRNSDSISASVSSAGAPYADFSSTRTIKPNKSKWLTIPVGPALTSTGAARYPKGARQADNALTAAPKTMRNQTSHRGRNPDGHGNLVFVKKNDTTAYLFAKKGVTGIGITKTNRLMFVLKRRVKIAPYTAGLMPFVDRRADQIVNTLLSFGSKL